MEKSGFKSIIFILGAFFGASSVALATDMAARSGGPAVSKSHPSHHPTDPRTWDQVRSLHRGATGQVVDARTWNQVRHLHREAKAQQADARTWDQVRNLRHEAAADARTWYQVRHLHGKANDGRVLADN